MKLSHRFQTIPFWGAWLCIACLTLSFWVGGSPSTIALDLNSTPSQADVAKQSPYGLCLNQEDKIDLNNANIIAFQDCPGFYPSLASIIVQNSPYQNIDEILEIESLNSPQRQALRMNIESFKLSKPITERSMRMPPRPSMRSNP